MAAKKKSTDPSPSSSPDPEDDNAQNVALMLRTKEGDIEAFQLLVEKHQSAVIGTVAKMMGSANDAEDLAQQVFVRVWKSAHRYEPKAKFTTWLFTITRNLVFNESRKRYRKSEVSMEAHEETYHVSTPDEDTIRPDDATLQQELVEAVDAAIQKLPEKQRMAVILRRYEDMPYEEIGKVLKLSLPAVKSLLFRARADLRKHLQSYLDAEE
ncbi:MAG: sigma-70 family RNA polymerase sigma factor [Verrucomicrobiota bacterium]